MKSDEQRRREKKEREAMLIASVVHLQRQTETRRGFDGGDANSKPDSFLCNWLSLTLQACLSLSSIAFSSVCLFLSLSVSLSLSLSPSLLLSPSLSRFLALSLI